MADGTAGYQPTPFANSLWAHMEKWCVDTGNPRRWGKWADGVYGDYRDVAENAVRSDSVRLHHRVTGILSSQAFAFNLFLPFREGNCERLAERFSELVGTKLTIDKVCFEWVPPGGLLGEIEGEWPTDQEPATGVDVVLWGWLGNGRRAVILVEVKLSEGGFTPCNGRTSDHNHRKDVCRSSQLFFQNPNVLPA